MNKMDELYSRVLEQSGVKLKDADLWLWLSLHCEDVGKAATDALRGLCYAQKARA